MDDQILLAEDLECAALKSLYDATPGPVRAKLGWRVDEIDGVTVSAARGGGDIVINRALGLGLRKPAHARTIAAVNDVYRAAGIARYFLHMFDEARTPESDTALVEAGLVPARGWMKFLRNVDAPPPVRTDLRVRKIGPDHGADYGHIVANGFDMGSAFGQVIAGLTQVPGWHVFMTFDADDRPAGGGALFVKDGLGWCDWGATDPAFRRRGAQGAALAARIEHARALGCHTLITATGEAVDGDPQHSYGNIERMGFRAYKSRPNYAWPKRP